MYISCDVKKLGKLWDFRKEKNTRLWLEFLLRFPQVFATTSQRVYIPEYIYI